MYCAFATITPKSEYFESARAAIINVLAETRQEEGCIQFEVHMNVSNTQLYLYERWYDQAALEFHYQQPYIKQVFAEYDKWLEIPLEVISMSPLEP